MDDNDGGAPRSAEMRSTVASWLLEQESEHPDEARIPNDRRFASWRCSVCGHALGEHLVDHSGEHTLFECPVSVDESEPVAQTPLGETGQTKF